MTSAEHKIPSLTSQIIQMIKDNYILIIVVTIIYTLIGSIDFFLMGEAAYQGPLQIVIELIVGLGIWVMLMQTSIVAIYHHQQPPNRQKDILTFTHPDFWKYSLKFYIDSIILFVASFGGSIVISALITFILITFSLIQSIEGIMFSFAGFSLFNGITLFPFLITKIPAILDPNGDTSFKAAFRRGKKIFWPSQGYMIALAIPFQIIISLFILIPFDHILVDMMHNIIIIIMGMAYYVTFSQLYMKAEYFSSTSY